MRYRSYLTSNTATTKAQKMQNPPIAGYSKLVPSDLKLLAIELAT